MPKIILILLALPLLSFGKDKASQPNPSNDKLSDLETCDSNCEKRRKKNMAVLEKIKPEFEKNIKLIESVPYYSKEDELAANGSLEKIKTDYENRFGEPITDFELSVMCINFNTEVRAGSGIFYSHFSVIRTAAGAVARYNPKYTYELVESELGIGDWLDFIRLFREIRVMEWKKEYEGRNVFHERGRQWKLEIFSFGGDNPDVFYGVSDYPPNFTVLEYAVDSLKKRVTQNSVSKSEIDLKWKSEYEKRFGKPIADLELSVSYIVYEYYDRFIFSAFRTPTGAFAKYGDLDAELSIGEWFDLVRALSKCVKGWESPYDDIFSRMHTGGWSFDMYPMYGGEGGFFSVGGNNFPPNWKEFEKIMEGMKKKIKSKAKAKAK